MTITAVKLNQFTAFRRLELEASPGINIFIGANSTGKTHLLKVIYAACDITRTKVSCLEAVARLSALPTKPWSSRVSSARDRAWVH